MNLSNLVWLIVAILVISWLLGVGGVYSLGGNHNLIHILIIVAIIAIIFNVVTGRRV